MLWLLLAILAFIAIPPWLQEVVVSHCSQCGAQCWESFKLREAKSCGGAERFGMFKTGGQMQDQMKRSLVATIFLFQILGSNWLSTVGEFQLSQVLLPPQLVRILLQGVFWILWTLAIMSFILINLQHFINFCNFSVLIGFMNGFILRLALSLCCPSRVSLQPLNCVLELCAVLDSAFSCRLQLPVHGESSSGSWWIRFSICVVSPLFAETSFKTSAAETEGWAGTWAAAGEGTWAWAAADCQTCQARLGSQCHSCKIEHGRWNVCHWKTSQSVMVRSRVLWILTFGISAVINSVQTTGNWNALFKNVCL